MAKQIFVSDEVYKILLANKGEYDSFSNVIMREFKGRGNAKGIREVAGKYKVGKDHMGYVKRKWKEWEKKFV